MGFQESLRRSGVPRRWRVEGEEKEKGVNESKFVESGSVRVGRRRESHVPCRVSELFRVGKGRTSESRDKVTVE